MAIAAPFPISGSAFAPFASRGPAVQDITALKAVPVGEREDKQLRFVEDQVNDYHFDQQSAAAESLPDIVAPNAGSGRWLRITPSGGVPAAHAASHQDGGTDELPVASLAEAAAPTNDVSRALRPDGAGGVAFSDVAHADLIGVGIDDHHARDHKARHVSGGADPFASTDLLEAIVKRLQTSTGPTTLLMGAVADEEFLRRVATGIVGVSADVAIQLNQFFADQLDNPTNADWIVATGVGEGLAPAVQDSVNNALTIRAHDDTDEEGIGLPWLVPPAGATKVKVFQVSRAEAGDVAVRTVGRKWYYRKIPDNAAVSGTWAGAGDGSKILDDVSLPATDEFFQYDEQTLTLASDFTPAIVPGDLYQFEFTRVAPAGGTNLPGDWNLLLLGLLFF